jgi:regulator of protease activity HflC (stomatin/prohibitin superfamily)
MDRLTRYIFAFLALAVALLFFCSLFFERIPVRTYGVKQNIWAGGIEPRDYETGYHVGITGVHRWHLLDASTHFLDFTEVEDRPGVRGRPTSSFIFPKSASTADLDTPVYKVYPALEIRNRDGNTVEVDVSVPYRIIAGEAHKIVADGAKSSYQERVKARVESMLREVLPEMSNEAFQDTEKRLATAAKVLETLNKELAEFHVRAEAVLIRRVAFPAEYEAKLQQKQLFTQKARLDYADTLKLAEVLRTGTIEKEIAAAEALRLAEWKKKEEELRAEYALQVAAIRAQAVQYSQQTKAGADATYQAKIAEGQLAMDKAEALFNQLRSEALATTGGRIYVARQAADNLNLSSVTLNASDPRVPLFLDVHKMAELLIGSPLLVPAPGAEGSGRTGGN